MWAKRKLTKLSFKKQKCFFKTFNSHSNLNFNTVIETIVITYINYLTYVMTYFSLGFSWKNTHIPKSAFSTLCILRSFLIILFKHNKIGKDLSKRNWWKPNKIEKKFEDQHVQGKQAKMETNQRNREAWIGQKEKFC